MKKRNILFGLLTILVGLCVIGIIFMVFHYMNWHISGDKWGMCLLFEVIIGMMTLFLSGSFFYDATKEQARTGRNR